MAGPVHYELYIRKTVPSPWTLIQAIEDRQQAVETAEQMLRDKEAVAVRVTKETMDPETKEFQSVAILTRGEPELPRKMVVENTDRPNCTIPADLYTPRAR